MNSRIKPDYQHSSTRRASRAMLLCVLLASVSTVWAELLVSVKGCLTGNIKVGQAPASQNVQHQPPASTMVALALELHAAMKLFQTLLPSSLLAAGFAWIGLAQAAQPLASAEPTAFHQVTAKLDAGGSLYAYLSTDRWLGTLSGKIAELRAFVLSLPDIESEDRRNLERVFALFENLARHSGLESVTGAGVSGIAVEKGLYRTRVVLQREPGTPANGYLWRWFGQEPHPLSWLDSLPPDTVYGLALDLDLEAIWTAVGDEARRAGFDPVTEAMTELSANIQLATGSTLEQHLASYGRELGTALILHPTRTFSIPLPNGETLDLPEPALVIALKVKDDRLFDFLDQLLAHHDGSSSGTTGTARWRTVPVPPMAPFPVEPIVARAGDTFWITSTRSLFDQLLAIQADKAPGLRTTSEFRRLGHGMPDRGNSWAFVSERFSTTLAHVQSAFMRQAAGNTAFAPFEALENFMGLAAAQSSFGVGWQDPDGAQSVTQGTQEPASTLIAAAAVAPAAIMAGTLLPALGKAKARAQEIACMNNLKQIGLGLHIYAVDHDDAFPPDFASLEAELVHSSVFICPADTDLARLRGRDWAEFDFANSSYEYLEPGLKSGEKSFDSPVVRCRIHGIAAHADGSVHR